MSKILATIEGCDWVQGDDGSLTVNGFCRVETDGSGQHHGDKWAQNQTTYKPYLNADTEFFVSIPIAIAHAVKGIVIGCKVQVTNLLNGKEFDAVCGDLGPSVRTGEVSYSLAIALGVNPNPNTGGDDEHRKYTYKYFPDVPAFVHGKQYKLQPL